MGKAPSEPEQKENQNRAGPGFKGDFTVEIAWIVAKQVIVMFLLMGVGVAAAKRGMLTDQAARSFSSLLLSVVMPCLLIEAYQQPYSAEQVKLLGFAFLLAVGFHFVTILLSHLLISKAPNGSHRVEIAAAVYSNCGFMGFPLIQATVGAQGIFYAAAFIGVFSVLTWSHGVMTLSGQRTISAKKILRNPAILGLALSLMLYFTGWQLPEVVGSTVGFLADLNTPLAMVITGVFLSEVDIKKTLGDFRVHFASLLRVVVFPCLMLAFLKFSGVASLLPQAEIVALTILIACACPTAASTVLMASRLGGDSTHGAKLLAVSTILSLVTLPLIVILYQVTPALAW